MKLRRALALALAAALLVPLAGRAAAQGVKIAGEPGAAAAKADAPKKPAAKPKKKPAKGRKKTAESKYKSRVASGSHYRFDANGNPVEGAGKKKPSAKGGKDAAVCSDDAPCADKKSSEADSL